MIYALNATSQSIDVQIVDDSGLPVTGLVAATFPTVKYSLAGPNADVTITLADLATITTAWASGGVKERGEGVYRLDLPDAALATAGKVRIRGEASGKRLVCPVLTVDAALSSAVAELTADPGATPTPLQALMLIYMALRNKIDVTASAKEIHKNDGTVLLTKTLSDDGTTYSESKMA